MYMSLGNLQSGVRSKLSMNAWIPLELLPIPLKRLDKLPDYPAEEQELGVLQIIHEIVSLVLSRLNILHRDTSFHTQYNRQKTLPVVSQGGFYRS